MRQLAFWVLSSACTSPLFALYNNGYLIAAPAEHAAGESWLADLAPPITIANAQTDAQAKAKPQVKFDSLSGDIKFPDVNEPSVFKSQDTAFDVPETDFSRYGRAFSDH